MEKNELLGATLASGIDPIETKLVAVRNTSDRQIFAYRTCVQLNTQSLGVLLPDDYEPVASRTVQCVKLALSSISDIAEIIEEAEKNNIKSDWFSAACPVRMLTKGSASKLIADLLEDIGMKNPSKLCLEFPAQILFEDSNMVAKELNALRFMGVGTALAGYGDDFCPTMRLADFPFDYVILDKSVSGRMASDAGVKSTAAMIAFVRSLGIELIADGVNGNERISAFYGADCRGYIPEPDILQSIGEVITDRV